MFIDIKPRNAILHQTLTMPHSEHIVDLEMEVDILQGNMARNFGLAALESGKIKFETAQQEHFTGKSITGSVAVLSVEELKRLYNHIDMLERQNNLLKMHIESEGESDES